MTVRGIVWGAVAGLAFAVGFGMAIALIDGQWPFNHTKTASQAAMDFTRNWSAPIATVVGAVLVGVLHRRGTRKASRCDIRIQPSILGPDRP